MSTKLDADNDTTAQPDPTVPHYPNKELIIFSGNDAEIPGVMHEIRLYLIRKVQGPAPAPTVGSSRARVWWEDCRRIRASHPVPHGHPRRSPRLRRPGAAAFALAAVNLAVVAPASAPPGSDLVINKFAVKHDDSKLLQLFEAVFGTYAEEEIVQASGSGMAFIPLILARGAAASGRAKALVLSKFTTFVAGGVSGELTPESNKEFFTTYDRLKRVLPA